MSRKAKSIINSSSRLVVLFIFIFLSIPALRVSINNYKTPQPINSRNHSIESFHDLHKCPCHSHSFKQSSGIYRKVSNVSSVCSSRASSRGPNQRVIVISLFGPKENKIFQFNATIQYLHQLIQDLNLIYPDNFILRIYHDDTISQTDIVCPIECAHSNVDFCALPPKTFIPPKIWRFLPIGDPLVDVMMSRDLDSPLTRRERAAVDAWFASNKSFHAMRDHPLHDVPMLGGMWGFRTSMDREFARHMYRKILNVSLIMKYGGRADQTFLTDEVWPYAKTRILVHDSFRCKQGYGQQPVAFPTRRIWANESECFVGCVRPCCVDGRMPFPECPKECRPPEHADWTFC